MLHHKSAAVQMPPNQRVRIKKDLLQSQLSPEFDPKARISLTKHQSEIEHEPRPLVHFAKEEQLCGPRGHGKAHAAKL
jgi:hypothetical protein